MNKYSFFIVTCVTILMRVSENLGYDSQPFSNEDIQFRQNYYYESCRCGERQSTQVKIVNGYESKLNEFPWRAALYLRSMTSRNYSYFCGASILNEQWLLTAAHCIDEFYAQSFSWVPMKVVAGAHDLASANEANRQEMKVTESNIFKHPEHNAGALNNNDIALIKLVKPLQFTRTVSPICLPYKFQNTIFTNEKVVATGWGITGEGRDDSGRKHRQVLLDLITNDDCQNRYKKNNPTNKVTITDKMICTYSHSNKNGGKDTCSGDSGGGIDYQDPRNERLYILGVISFGEGCGREDRPGVYTRVTKYLEWIKKVTGTLFCNQ